MLQLRAIGFVPRKILKTPEVFDQTASDSNWPKSQYQDRQRLITAIGIPVERTVGRLGESVDLDGCGSMSKVGFTHAAPGGQLQREQCA
jgi:hypothetical protein